MPFQEFDAFSSQFVCSQKHVRVQIWLNRRASISSVGKSSVRKAPWQRIATAPSLMASRMLLVRVFATRERFTVVPCLTVFRDSDGRERH